MRAFRFQHLRRPARGFRRPVLTWWALLPVLTGVLAAAASPLHAQFPGELQGRVVEAGTGRPVDGAAVEVPPAGLTVLTAPSGAFRIRALDPGSWRVRITRLGFAPAEVDVTVENGRTRYLTVELQPSPLPVAGLTVQAGPWPGAVRILPDAAARASARTAADLLAGAPGVALGERGPGGEQTVSIRGSGAGAVLVLLDGIPLNDPLTGVADLSALAASSIAAVTVLPGARGARYGAGAEGGVVLLESVGAALPAGATLALGSLGHRAGGLEGGAAAGPARISGGVQASTLEGSFDYQHPPELGAGRARRANADLHRLSARAALETPLAGATLRVRGLHERLERGLPGKAYAPSTAARQTERSWLGSADWDRTLPAARVRVAFHGAWRRMRFRDPEPPLGLPFDESTRARRLGLSVDVGGDSPGPGGVGWTVGGSLEHQGIRSQALGADVPGGRTDAALHGAVALRPAGPVQMGLALRGHRDGLARTVHVSHEASAELELGRVRLHGAHRSAFTPPALADQFFREGVGVAPNPDLRPERVPGEVELGVRTALVGGRWSGSAALGVFGGRVRDMIVWVPDYRFVWSPRNEDVHRRGLELRAEVARGLGEASVRLSGSWTHARVTYARPGRKDVQVMYRPRDTGAVTAAWEDGASTVRLHVRRVGGRNPVPAAVNALPAFQEVDLTVSRRLSVGGWTLRPTLAVERLLGGTEALLFGYPVPGRTLRLELHLSPDPHQRPRP